MNHLYTTGTDTVVADDADAARAILNEMGYAEAEDEPLRLVPDEKVVTINVELDDGGWETITKTASEWAETLPRGGFLASTEF